MKQCVVPFYAVTLSQLLYLLLRGGQVYFSARSGILAAALGSMALGLLLVVLAGLSRWSYWPGIKRPYAAFCRAVFWVWGVVLLVRLSLISRVQYRAGGLWVLLLVVWLLHLRVDWHALCRMHQALMGFAVAAALLLVGLVPRLRLANLSTVPVTGGQLGRAFMALCCLCPEWLALPFAGKKGFSLCKGVPLLVFLTQSGALFLAEAVFGWQAETGRFAAVQAVRLCGLGAFARLDDIFVGLWLLLCLYRLTVLWQLVQSLKKEGGTNVVSYE